MSGPAGAELGGSEMFRPQEGFIIALDGPVAAGKGSVAAALADRLNGFYMNTGAMYRAVALYCIEHEIETVNNESGVSAILPQVSINIVDRRIMLNGRDVTERIMAPDTDKGSSVVAVYGSVREAMVKRQQEIGKEVTGRGEIVIAEGRDAATKIFPEARIKIFLDASVDERASRRQAQYRAKGIEKTFDEAKREIEERDDRDSNRAIDPLQLKNPEGAGYCKVDSTGQKPEETVGIIVMKLVEEGLIEDDQN